MKNKKIHLAYITTDKGVTALTNKLCEEVVTFFLKDVFNQDFSILQHSTDRGIN